MAVEANIITIATGTGTSQVNTAHGMTATPQVAILLHSALRGVDQRVSIGAFTSATERAGFAIFSDGGTAASDTASLIVTDGCLPILNDTTTVDGQLDAVGFDATNVSVIPDNAFTASNNVSCLLLAGLTNVKVGTITVQAATGTQAITGIGFQPDVLLFFGVSGVAAGTIAAHARFCYGWGTASQQRALATNSRDAQDPTATWALISDDYAWVTLAATTGAVSDGFVISTMDSDGFTLNKLVGGNTPIVGYVALKGCQAKIVDSAMRTDTNNQTVTGVGFSPRVVLQMIRPEVAASEEGTSSDHAEWGAGWAVSSSKRYSMWAADEDNLATTDVYATQSTTRFAINFDKETGAVDGGDMDFVSLDSDGCTLDQDTAAAAAIYLPLLFLGDAASTGPSNPSVDNASTGLRRSARRMVAIGD